MVKHLPAMQETWVRFLGREDPLEKEMAIHSSTFARKIPWTEKPDRLQSMGSQSQTRLSDFTIALSHSYATLLSYECYPVNAFFFFLLFLYLYILMQFQELSRVRYLQTIWRRQKELMFLALHISVEQIIPT